MEEEHLLSATYRFGAKEAKKRHAKTEKQYELLEDEIDFIQGLKMPKLAEDVKEEDQITEHEKKRMTIAESLLVFPFKKSLI